MLSNKPRDKTKMVGGESVEIKEFDLVDDFDAREWPPGQDILDMLQSNLVETTHGPEYWQASARWALLKKYKLLRGSLILDGLQIRKPVEIIVNGDTVRHLHFSEPEIKGIQETWTEYLGSYHSTKDVNENSELYEFLETKKSNTRLLKWSTMSCPPGCQFKLHAHPNLELVYCARGSLHEVRMEGEPITKKFVTAEDNPSSVKGPDLSALSRTWHFATLSQGDWLVNEVGSVHKSFTASKGDGCLLVVLWGGSHANVSPGDEPKTVNVQLSVDEMDKRLGNCGCSEWEAIEEIFLPESERSGI